MPNALLTFWNLHRISILMVLISLGFYTAFGYDLQRSDSLKLLGLYAALFFLCYKLIQFEKWNFRFLAVSGVLFRLVLIFSLPGLSQDFYRFIWDGSLILEGMNPYAFKPEVLMEGTERLFPLAPELFAGMGELSQQNYSNYPPLNQYAFAAAVALGGKSLMGSVIAMKVMTLLADLGILYFGRRLLKQLNMSPHLILWYFLNPLVIIELSGNLHFEGVMLFFFVLAMFLVFRGSWLLAAIPYGLAISLKLIPLMFLPLFIPFLGWRRSPVFFLATAGVVLACIYPLYFPDFGSHYGQTLRLWFSNFEFNASLYNLSETIFTGKELRPWEYIRIYGKYIPLLTVLVTIGVSFHPKVKTRSGFMTGSLLILCIYYFTAAVVHPWYIIFPVLLGIFAAYRFVLVWSATVVLSYIAYANYPVEENSLILLIEYFAVFVFLIYELLRNKRIRLPIFKN